MAIISTAMMASSTSRPSAMISAPSEMRCRSMPNTSMPRKVTASTSGTDSATTTPVRSPRLMKLTASTMTTASRERAHELLDGAPHHRGLVRDLVHLDPHRQVALEPRHLRA